MEKKSPLFISKCFSFRIDPNRLDVQGSNQDVAKRFSLMSKLVEILSVASSPNKIILVHKLSRNVPSDRCVQRLDTPTPPKKAKKKKKKKKKKKSAQSDQSLCRAHEEILHP